MDLGGVGKERIVLNESSVWTGGPYDGNRYDAYQCLPSVRSNLFAGNIREAQKELERTLATVTAFLAGGIETNLEPIRPWATSPPIRVFRAGGPANGRRQQTEPTLR